MVDDSTIGRSKPSAAADKFIQEQTQQQQAFQQQQQFEQQQKQQIHNQQAAVREAELLQQQQEAKQAFMQQQQLKQEQSMEVRRIQEMAQQEISFPENFQHTSLKQRSFTPSLDLGCHNVQGINVWANTAPRGWGSAQSTLNYFVFQIFTFLLLQGQKQLQQGAAILPPLQCVLQLHLLMLMLT